MATQKESSIIPLQLKQPDKDLVSFNIEVVKTFFCTEDFTAGILREKKDKDEDLDLDKDIDRVGF